MNNDEAKIIVVSNKKPTIKKEPEEYMTSNKTISMADIKQEVGEMLFKANFTSIIRNKRNQPCFHIPIFQLGDARLLGQQSLKCWVL